MIRSSERGREKGEKRDEFVEPLRKHDLRPEKYHSYKKIGLVYLVGEGGVSSREQHASEK